ncbi:MAG: tyrosine--tRNA ligase [Alphaproteobacteria bacterium]|nr:tyrosine--tRNA ligase [Alphaproteobacteria bacterium]
MKSEFLQIIQSRGFFHQATDIETLDTLMSTKSITGYIGFDMTADSLHVGSLVQIMMLRWLQKTGHRPLILLGGGTSKVGDPSGKEAARQMLDNAAIQNNTIGIRKSFEPFIDMNQAIMLNNDTWLSTLNYIEFLRDYGRHFSVNRMLAFDSVKLRLEREQNLSFLEFNYMILQGYDFLELFRRHDCVLQMGGSDQWGNIVNGIELTRRCLSQHVYGLTSPLITTSSGAKMGKTSSGAVWLNTDRLSAYDYWQFWRNTEDADVGRYLRLFTELPLDEINRLEALQGAEINDAKKILADHTTGLAHGNECLTNIHDTTASLYENQSGSLDSLPTFEISSTDVNKNMLIIDLLTLSGLAASRGEARRLIQGNGARLNDRPILDESQKIIPELFQDGILKLSAGKKRHVVIKYNE